MEITDRILLCLCHMSGREMDFIKEAFDGEWVVPLGPHVNGFEKDLEKFFLGAPPQPSPQGRELGCRSQEGRERSYHTANPLNYELLKSKAKDMRKNPTQAEAIMWELLRNNKLGIKFRRQHIIGDYIVDFVDLNSGLIIEIDGGYHNTAEQREYDELRSEYLKNKGYTVLRFPNEQVIGDSEAVLERIRQAATTNKIEEDKNPLPSCGGCRGAIPVGELGHPKVTNKIEEDKNPLPPCGGCRGARIVALSSGTAAIHMALIALGVGAGDEVMVQSFTFSASANPVTYVGATPVFVDSEPETWNMDPQLLDEAIADRVKKTGKKPKAIIPVYLYGMPAKIDEILAVAEKWDIPLLEDAAEAFGSCYKGQKCGTFGRFGALSFNGNKMITTSGGGALICPDEKAYKLVMNYATQSREPYPWYQHERIGYNYRLSNISAAIGRGQMTIAEEHIAHHRHVQALYRELFADMPGIKLHENPGRDFDSNFWLCTITFGPDLKVKGDDGCGRPEAMRRILNEANIESRHLWKPMHLQPVFAENPAYVNGVSEDLFSRGLCIPAGPYVGDAEVHKVVEAIRSAII